MVAQNTEIIAQAIFVEEALAGVLRAHTLILCAEWDSDINATSRLCRTGVIMGGRHGWCDVVASAFAATTAVTTHGTTIITAAEEQMFGPEQPSAGGGSVPMDDTEHEKATCLCRDTPIQYKRPLVCKIEHGHTELTGIGIVENQCCGDLSKKKR